MDCIYNTYMSQKLNKLHSYLLTIKLGFYCLYYPLKAIFASYYRPNDFNYFNKIIKRFADKLIFPLKIKFILNNWQQLENLPKNKPIILLSNHSSAYDIPIILHAIPNSITLRMLAKKELRKVPIFGYAMERLGFPIINRQNRTQAIKDLEKTKELMQSGIIIWACPEGTRSNDHTLLPFKKGVFIMAQQIDALIIPVSIKNAYKVLPPKTLNFSLNETIELTVGEPIDAKNFENNILNKDKIMAHIRTEIAKYL